MSKKDRAVLWLVAQGRISVGEAERLLAPGGYREMFAVLTVVILAVVLSANDPSLWLAGAAQGLLHAVPCLGEAVHRVQTAVMGI